MWGSLAALKKACCATRLYVPALLSVYPLHIHWGDHPEDDWGLCSSGQNSSITTRTTEGPIPFFFCLLVCLFVPFSFSFYCEGLVVLKEYKTFFKKVCTCVYTHTCILNNRPFSMAAGVEGPEVNRGVTQQDKWMVGRCVFGWPE